MNSNVDYLSRLPWDIKVLISAYLKPIDVYCLIGSDKHFEGMMKTNKLKALDFSIDTRLTSKMVREVHVHMNGNNITHINLNGVYWIKAEHIRKFAKRLPNLEYASLIGTKLCCEIDLHVFYSLRKLRTLILGYKLRTVPVKFKCFINKDGYVVASPMSTSKQIIVTEYRPLENKYIVYDSDWMNEAVQVLLSNDAPSLINQLDVSKSRLEIDFNKCGDQYAFERVSEVLPDIKQLIIRCGKMSSVKTRHLDLNVICSFKNLQILKLEVNTGSNNFLENVFSECKQLKLLKIISHVPQFNVSQFRNARALEHLSLELKGTFQLEKFLMDLKDNEHLKLKRIHLKFWKFSKLSIQLLQDFFHQNPQLFLFAVFCEMTETFLKNIDKILKKMCTEEHQQFFFKKLDPLLNIAIHIEPYHYDLLDACYSVN